MTVRAFILIKGAPERVLAMCAAERTAEGDVPIERRAVAPGGDGTGRAR